MKYLKIFFFVLIAHIYSSTYAVSPGEVRFGNESADTVTITNILQEIHDAHYKTTNEKIIAIARKLIDTPYGAGTLECSPEQLTVNLSAVDCTTFVEYVTAMAMTIDENRTSWHDFIYNLERLRYRNGQINGYSSRLHYVSDWIIDNAHRGILQDVTDRIAIPSYQIKTLDFMSRNRDKYPALAEDEEFEKLKNAEIGYRSHRIPYIKPTNTAKLPLNDGDIIIIISKTQGLDAQHMGFAINIDGQPHLLHASSAHGKVLIDPLSISEYLKRNRSASGIRVVRLKE
ncbi:MAG: DUF1460 domain-containing protein [Paramuribaculum sp.]|nr:DUF1460 domain-containing protein [Paramuribaculum sp.]